MFTLPKNENVCNTVCEELDKSVVVLADDASPLVPLFSLHNLNLRYF